jgi:hypothetical protein
VNILTVSRVAREVISKILASIPDYIIKGLGALLRWYWRLGMVAMFIVAAVIGAAAVSALPMFITSPASRASIQHTVGTILVLWLLVVLIIGVIRPGRR